MKHGRRHDRLKEKTYEARSHAKGYRTPHDAIELAPPPDPEVRARLAEAAEAARARDAVADDDLARLLDPRSRSALKRARSAAREAHPEGGADVDRET